MIESSDLNDSDILEQTSQLNDGKGNIKFKITLPSGRELSSEWISPDHRRTAIHAWLEAVKAQAVADSEAEEAERNARLRRKAAESKPVDEGVANAIFGGPVSRAVDEPRASEPSPSRLIIPPEARQAPVSNVSVPADGEPDAMEYVKRRVTQANAALVRASVELRRWQTILSELSKEEAV